MMEKRKFFTHFDPPPSPALKCEDASLTRQEFVSDADINNIMKRYAAGIPLPQGNLQPQFGDFSDVPDFQKAFQLVEDANSLFAELPSEVRLRFNNDPQQLLAFLQDEGNRSEAVKLGLIEPPVEKPAEKPAESVSVPETKVEGEGK